MHTRFARAAAALAVATLVAAPIARADSPVDLIGLTFDDGGTASGVFTTNVYGYLSPPIDITTTAGSTLPGFLYTDATAYLSALPPQDATTFDFSLAGYGIDLHLVFEDPISPANGNTPPFGGPDPLVLGGASYETCTYSCPAGTQADSIRYLTAGSAYVPEPASLALLGAGLLGLAAARRRRLG